MPYQYKHHKWCLDVSTLNLPAEPEWRSGEITQRINELWLLAVHASVLNIYIDLVRRNETRPAACKYERDKLRGVMESTGRTCDWKLRSEPPRGSVSSDDDVAVPIQIPAQPCKYSHLNSFILALGFPMEADARRSRTCAHRTAKHASWKIKLEKEGRTKRKAFLQLLQLGRAFPLGGRRIAANFLSRAVSRSVAIHFA